MVIRGRAPLRISFGGGGTGVAPFHEEQGRTIIGSTINKYACCPIILREDDQIVVHSMDFDTTVKYNTSENYVYDGKLDLATAAPNAMGTGQGYEVYLQRDAPPGSGLGTSSTAMMTIFVAMTHWRGVVMDIYVLTDLAYQVGRLDPKTDGGYQDQHTATFGSFNSIEFHGRNNVVVSPLRTEEDIIHKLQYSLLLCYIGKIHVSASIAKDQVQNYEKGGAFGAICEAKALAYALRDELLKGDLHSFGKLLDYGWQSKKRMSNKIVNPQIGQPYDKVLKAGALGGKLLGAGEGGYLLMHCPCNVRHKVIIRMEQADGQLVDWNFELRGTQNQVANEPRWQYDRVKVHTLSGEYRFNI